MSAVKVPQRGKRAGQRKWLGEASELQRCGGKERGIARLAGVEGGLEAAKKKLRPVQMEDGMGTALLQEAGRSVGPGIWAGVARANQAWTEGARVQKKKGPRTRCSRSGPRRAQASSEAAWHRSSSVAALRCPSTTRAMPPYYFLRGLRGRGHHGWWMFGAFCQPWWLWRRQDHGKVMTFSKACCRP